MCSGHVPGDLKGPTVQVDIVGYISITDILSLGSSEHTIKGPLALASSDAECPVCNMV